MARTGNFKDVGLAIIMLRSLPSPPWNQSELSRQSGVDQSQISDYERGKSKPRRTTLARLAAPVGVEVSFFEQIVPVCRGIRLAFERASHQGRTGGRAELETAPGLEGKIARAAQEAMAPFLLQLSQRSRRPAPRAEDRVWAEERWSRLKPLPAETQSLLVEVLLGDERSWALAERLCLASAAADRASEALRLARLAVRLVERCPGPERWRLRFRGWCGPFLANALRVGDDLAAAERTYATADELWRRGAGGDPAGLLDPGGAGTLPPRRRTGKSPG